MDLGASNINERLGSLSKNEGPGVPKKDDNLFMKPGPGSIEPTFEYSKQSSPALVQRCVIVQKDEKGYGLTVSGDNPVFVQSVKEDGAAAKAGVQTGDRIIKVNGSLVTQCNHVEVVGLIRSGTHVALTLLGRAPGVKGGIVVPHLPPSSSPPGQRGSGVYHGNMSITNKMKAPTERVTAPQPVDAAIQQHYVSTRLNTVKLMLEQEKGYLDKLKSDYAKTPSDKIKEEMMRTKNRVKNLEFQLCDPSSNQHQMLPHSPPPLRSPVECHPWVSGRVMSEPPPPPPPPRRHVAIQSQMSLPISSSPPVPPVRNESRLHSSMVAANDTTSGANEQPCHMPPPSPPPPPPTHYPMSYSMDNIQKMSVAPGVVWSSNNFTHSRQRSSPDAILHQTENLRQQVQGNNNNSSHTKLKNSHDLSRSHSEITGNRKYGSNESYAAVMAKKRKSAEGSSRASSFGAYDSTSTESPRGTPPGTPPPPYSSFEPGEHAETNEDTVNQQDETPGSPKQRQFTVNNNIETDVQMTHNIVSPADNAIKVFGTQLPIMSLDDDDLTSDTETGSSDGHGPFECLAKLLKHQAHLAVFLRYLMQTNDPSSLFFYLISDIYKEGAGKEMKKWAYEIHSTFLLPGAPLKVKNIDDTILRDIGQVLASELDKEETLRKIFWKARKKASEELKDHLKDICQKKTLGVIGLYGASDSDLEDAMHDKNKEIKIVENTLLKDLEMWMVLPDPPSDRPYAMASALATLLLKVFGIKNQSALSIIERVPTFVSKDKSRIKFLKGNKKAVSLQGHHFVPQHYFNITYCNHCQLTIWGVGNQGYQCQTCELNIHKQCMSVLEEFCLLAPRASKKDKKRVSGIMENFMGKNRKPSNLSSAAIEKARRLQEEGGDVTVSAFYLNSDVPTETSGERVPHHRVEKLRKRFESSATKLTENEEVNTQGPPHEDHHGAGNGDVNSTEANGAHDSSKKGTSITRSESLRTRREQRPSFRKRSDPNIPRSNSDVDVDDRPVSGLNQSGSSSNSSLSAKSIDSPSNSLEAVHRPNEVSPLASGAPTIGQSSPGQEDSDLEAEPDPPNWTDSVDNEVIKYLKPKEKKRQEVINELFHTERNHVRNLKVLHRVFYHHMKNSGILQPEQIKLLFANLEDMLEIHGRLNSMMKDKRKKSEVPGLVDDVGEMMLQLFDGVQGANFREAACTFCRNQSVALESLKSWQKKDQKLAQFLVDATAFPVCRRLQLKDIIPTAMQRLTKYPLLLENLAKYTNSSTPEHTNLLRALDRSKDILNAVNQAVKEAEDNHRLQELQRKIDRGPFDKVDNPMTQEFKNLDVTKYKLVHEGQLIWRVNRQKTVDLHALVLSDFIVLLQKQDEKYVLKYHNTNIMSGKEETKLIYSPIIKMANLLSRNVATDKKAFFLVSYSQSGPQIYELVALSHTDRKTWIRHITEAAEKYNKTPPRPGEKVPEVPQLPPEPEEHGDDSSAETTLKNKDSLDNSESQEAGETDETSDTGEQSDAREPLDTAGSSLGSTLSPEAKSVDVESVGAVSPTASIASGSSYSGSSHGPSVSPAGQRRFQRVETLQIAEGLPLIEPSEVVVSESAVLQTAEPVLTPIEKLRRKDQAISKALEEKQQLVADILHIPRVDFEHVSDIASDGSGEKDAKELVLAAIVQATRLADLINATLSVTEIDAVSATTDVAGSSTEPSPKPPRKDHRTPGVPVEKLVPISSALHVRLTHLLSLVTEREEERERLRQELRASREQIHLLHESRRRTPVSHSPSNSISHSRPNSFISVGSSTSELGEINEHIPPESDEDEKLLTFCESGIQTRLALHSTSADGASPLIEAFNSALVENQYDCEDPAVELFVDASESSTDPVEEDSQVSNIPEAAVEPETVEDTLVQNIVDDDDDTGTQNEMETSEIAQVEEQSASSGDVH